MEKMSQKRERPATPIPQSPDYPPPKRRKYYIPFPEMPDLERPILRPQQRREPISFHPDKDLAGKFGELPRELQDLIREYGVPTIEECNAKIAERKLKNIRKQLMDKRENVKYLDTVLIQEKRLERAAEQIGRYFGMSGPVRFLRSMKKWIPSYQYRTTEEIVDHHVRHREASDELWLLPYRYSNRHNPPPTEEARQREEEVYERVQRIREERGPWQIPGPDLMRAIIGSRLRGYSNWRHLSN